MQKGVFLGCGNRSNAGMDTVTLVPNGGVPASAHSNALQRFSGVWGLSETRLMGHKWSGKMWSAMILKCKQGNVDRRVPLQVHRVEPRQ
jgi:hypothetical protein